MTDFVLVHGAYHGAWCWDRFVPELEQLGHRGFVMDLPCDDADAGFDDNIRAVTEVIDRHQLRDAVVVGHSLGGFTVPLVAHVRPVRMIVFLCTAPVIGSERGEELRARMVTDDYRASARFFDAGGRALSAPADARRAFFDDCDDATADWALARLRPQGQRTLTEPWPITRWPDCPRAVVIARDDRAVRYDAALEAARLILDGADPEVIDGGHSPFLARPAELALRLQQLSASVQRISD